ncbi:MAG: oligoendopeptidase F [Deinococcota bacterium]|jgi:oligoendopeptidase F|nr:oligoendopeptidase F [Deinococcota bacterium]
MAGVANRGDVAAEERWNDESVFSSPESWEEAMRSLQEALPRLESFRGRVTKSPAGLADWLEAYGDITGQLGKLVVYASMAYSCDTTDREAAARYDRARGLSARVTALAAFAEPEMIAAGFDTLRAWTREEPRLSAYAHYLERLKRRAAHVRSAEVEALLGAVQDPFNTAAAIHGVLANTDMVFAPAVGEDGEKVEITQGTIRALLGSADRELRKSAWQSYADAHLATQNTTAACLSAGIKQNNFLAGARRYESALEASLAVEAIPLTVFYNLLDTFKANLPTWHRYWRVKRQALGYDKLHAYDIFAPLTVSSPAVGYEQAVDWLLEAMKPLGDAYLKPLRRGALEERWVDRAVNRGKRMGAFSSGVQGTHPFIMMSYTGDVFAMSTLAHEFGHSMHSYLSWGQQPRVYSRYSLFVAEVASNFNQAMLRAHLFEGNQDKAFQIALIEEAMANFHRYFFVMPTLARFELEVHERAMRGEALSASSLNELMAALFAEGYGGEVEADGERTGITWAQFHTHLYSRFYVYQYATGIAGAHALSEGILAGEEGAAERYLDFLKAGGSRYPLDALRLAGVDLTTPAPVEKTFAVLAGLVERLEALIARS